MPALLGPKHTAALPAWFPDSAEFDQAFTGVVLTFEKGPDFKPGGTAPSVLRSVAR